MTTPVNPIYGQGETDLFHAGEAPPAGHSFHPSAHCGVVMAGERFSELPKGADLCAIDKKWLGIDDEKTSTPTPTKPAEKKETGSNG